MVGAEILTPRLARKLSGLCEVQGCTEPCGAASSECPEHHEKSKAYKRKWWERQTAIRKASNRCRCGAKSKGGRRCRACKDAIKRKRRDDRARLMVPVPRLEVSGSVKIELGRDGATRTRQVFRRGQSGKTKEEVRRGHMRIADDMTRLLAVWRSNYTAEMDDLISAMPRVQRTEARSRRADLLAQVLRQASLLAEETDPTRLDACQGCGREHDKDDESPTSAWRATMQG